MRIFLEFFILFCWIFAFVPTVSFAVDSNEGEETTKSTQQDNEESIRSALLFAERKEWKDALLHAKQSGNGALKNLITWQYLLDTESGASFSEIKKFLENNKDWPERDKLRMRAELMIFNEDVSEDDIVEFFKSDLPMTGVGKLELMNALKREIKKTDDSMKSMVREAWRDGDFDEDHEQKLLTKYGNIITKADDIARTDRLIWEGKTSQAGRMFARVGEEHKKLYHARLALQANAKNAQKLVVALPKSVRGDVGLRYDLIAYLSKRGDSANIRKLLISAPKKVPYPERWWKYREKQIRIALDDGKIPLAVLLLSNHGQIEGKEYADANWLRGWLMLKYQKRAKDAYSVFSKMFEEMKYPVSKARAAYWASRSARLMKDEKNAKTWMEKAAKYPTAFYGQLANFNLHGSAPLKMPAQPVVSASDRAEFNVRSVVKATKLCIEYGKTELAGKIITAIVEENADNAALASEIGNANGKTYLSVKAAKKALRHNIVLLDTGYPTPKTPDGLKLPRALTLSITRQESEFDRYAKSPAAALGMMQLLPATAKEVASKNDIDFDIDDLYEPQKNMRLGSLYLQHLIDNYDGDLVMAIAAYNAGGGNVYKWTKKIGKPSGSVERAVDWIEEIPFSETRNYVQRVIENLQVYRHIEADGSQKLLIGQDLGR